MSFVYGVILVIVGAVGGNLGNNLVSLGHKESFQKEKACSKKVANLSVGDETLNETEKSVKVDEEEDKSCISWTNIGRLVFVLGSLFNFAGFAFGAQSLLSSLESVEFVSNVVFVHYVHHEPVTLRMTLATLAIVAGNVLVVVFGEQEAENFNSDQMIHLYKTNTAYHAYLVLVFIVWGVTSYAYSTYHESRMKKRVLMWQHSFMEPLCYAISSSIIGTQAVLNSKCLALLIDTTLSGEKNEFAFWYLYMVLGTWIVMVAYWLIRLDQGLALFPPAFIIPLMQVVFMIFAILCGGIYFKEFEHFTTMQYILFSVGVIMIVAGVYGLAPLDMKLYVPGDPNAPDPVKMCEAACSATVHSELVLPMCHMAAVAEDELEKMFEGALHIKPGHHLFQHDDKEKDQTGDFTDVNTDLNIYSSMTNGEQSEVSSPTGCRFDFQRESPHKQHKRKVVKRPVSDLPDQLPPVNSRSVSSNRMSVSSAESGSGSPRAGSSLVDGSKVHSYAELSQLSGVSGGAHSEGPSAPLSARSAKSHPSPSQREALPVEMQAKHSEKLDKERTSPVTQDFTPVEVPHVDTSAHTGELVHSLQHSPNSTAK